MSWHVSPWVYPVCDSLHLLDLIDYFLFHVGEIFNYNLFKNFLIPFVFLLVFWDPYNSNVGAFNISQRSLRLYSVLFILFTLCCFSAVISTILSSSSLIRSSASDILLFIPSRVFLTSVIVLFVSVCLFFSSSRSLLIDRWILNHWTTREVPFHTLFIYGKRQESGLRSPFNIHINMHMQKSGFIEVHMICIWSIFIWYAS